MLFSSVGSRRALAWQLRGGEPRGEKSAKVLAEGSRAPSNVAMYLTGNMPPLSGRDSWISWGPKRSNSP